MNDTKAMIHEILASENYILVGGGDVIYGEQVNEEIQFLYMAEIIATFVLNSKAKDWDERKKCLDDCINAVREVADSVIETCLEENN